MKRATQRVVLVVLAVVCLLAGLYLWMYRKDRLLEEVAKVGATREAVLREMGPPDMALIPLDEVTYCNDEVLKLHLPPDCRVDTFTLASGGIRVMVFGYVFYDKELRVIGHHICIL